MVLIAPACPDAFYREVLTRGFDGTTKRGTLAPKAGQAQTRFSIVTISDAQ